MTQNFSYAAGYSPTKYTSHFPTYIYEPRKIFYCPRLGCQNDRTEAQLMSRHTSHFPTYVYEPRKIFHQPRLGCQNDRTEAQLMSRHTSRFPTYIYAPRKIFYCPRLGCQNDRKDAQLLLRHTSRFPTYIYEPRKMDTLLSKTWVSAGHDRGTVIVEMVFAYHNFHSQGLCLVLTYFQRLKTGLLRSEDWSTFMDSATPGHIYMLICQKIGRVQCLCNFFLLWGWEWQIPRHAVSTFSGVQV